MPAATDVSFAQGAGDPAQVTISYMTTVPPAPSERPTAVAVRGDATIKQPGTTAFVPLTAGTPTPLGAVVDASPAKSQATLVADVRRGPGSSLAQAAISLGTVTILGPSRSDPRTLALRLPRRAPASCRPAAAAAAQGRQEEAREPQGEGEGEVQGACEDVTGDVIAVSLGTSWTSIVQ